MIEKFYATGNKVYCGAEIVQDGLSPNRAEKLAKQLNEIHNEDNKKTSIDDIIGIVKTDEPTNSVEEVRKLRGRTGMTEKRFMIDVAEELDENAVFCNDEFICLVDDTDNLVKVFNYLVNENEQLSRECESLTIKKQELELEIIRLENIIKTGKRRRAVDKEKEQRMFLVDMEKQRKMFR